MKKFSLFVIFLLVCGIVFPSFANLPAEDGCEDKCECEEDNDNEGEGNNDASPGNSGNSGGTGSANVDSVSIWVNWGAPANENISGNYRFSIYTKKPTPMIYSPQIIQYRNLLLDRISISEINQQYKQEIRGERYASEETIYSDGKVVRILSDGGGQEKLMTSLAADVTHLIKIFTADREMMIFQFKSGSSVGTMIGETSTMNNRLVMIDSSGNPTTTNPTYYDRYLGYGNFLRYSAETGNVVSYHTAMGRIVTPDAVTVGVEPIYEEDGTIRQVWSLGDGLADIVVTEAAVSYEIRCYSPDKVGAKVNGLYTVTGEPHTVWKIENPNPGTNTKVKVTKTVNGVSEVSLFEYSHNAEGWLLKQPGDLAIESQSTSWDYSQTVKVVTTIEKTPEGQVASKVARTYQKYPFGDRIVNVSVDPDGVNLRTQTTYYTDSGDIGSYGRKKTENFPDGYWAAYEYDAQGREIVKITPWKNSVFNSLAPQAKAEYKSFVAHDPRDIIEVDDMRPRTEETKILGITTSKTYHAYYFDGDEYVEIEERCVNGNASYGDSSNLRTERRYYPKGLCSSPSAGRIHTVKYPDGTMDTYTYEYGTWNPNSDLSQSSFTVGAGTAIRVKITHGTIAAPQGIANKTLQDCIVYDSRGCLVYSTQAFYLGSGYEIFSWTVNTFDELRRLISQQKSNNELTEYTWNCCNKASETLPDGTRYTYVYDDLRRLISKTKVSSDNHPDLVTTYQYDAANRLISETISGGGLSSIASWEYNLAGQLVKKIDHRGVVTQYSYLSGKNNGDNIKGQTIIISHLDDTTTIILQNLDRLLRSVTGNAQVPAYHDYSVDASGNVSMTIHLAGDNSPRWQKITRNLIGEVIQKDWSGYNNSTLSTRLILNDKKQIVKIEKSNYPDQLLVYDDLGNLVKTGWDINADGSLINNSTDKIFNFYQTYQKENDKVWLEKKNTTFPENNSDKEIVTSISRTLLNNFESNISYVDLYYDANNNIFSRKLYIDRSKKKITVESLSPASSIASLEQYENGLLSSYRNIYGQVTSFQYDSLQRLIRRNYARIGTEQITYHSVAGKNGLVATITDPAGYSKEFDYDSVTGRLVSIKNSLGKWTRYAYNSQGKIIRVWGDAVYPVSLSYNQYGQVETMISFRNSLADFSGTTFPVASGDVVSWTYDIASGLPIAQTDSDNHLVSYSYTPDGKLVSRTWAREIAGEPLVTTYDYDSMGYLKEITYSDNTPNVSFTYNRLGNLSNVVDDVGTRQFSYNDSMQLISEIISGEYNKTITRNYTNTGLIGRKLSLEIDGIINHIYSYDEYGRISSVNNINFTRLENSNLIQEVVRPNQVNTVRNYENNRDLISSCSNGNLSTYAYTYNALGNQISVLRTGSAFSAANQITYTYNSRNEIIGASSPDEMFSEYDYSYEYDHSGNRISANLSSESFVYTANALNQYESINNTTVNYDADGNTISWGNWQYDWDAENRMISASSGNIQLVFEYDYLGRRTSKKTFSGGTLISHTRFIYDGFKLLEELDALNNNCSLRKYTWASSELGRDIPLTLTTDGNTYYYHVDSNKNVTEITDALGNQVAHYEYSPFGLITKAVGTLAEKNPFRFSSEYYDTESGLVYYNYRYYNPALGRWVNRDPIGFLAGINLYLMVNNDPINYYDSLGLWSLKTHKKLARDAWNAAENCKDKCKDDKDDFMDDLEDGSVYPDIPISWKEYFIPLWSIYAFSRDASRVVRTHWGDRQFWHGMASEGESADDIQGQIGERLANAVNDFRKDPCGEGHKLGEAAHTLADTYCPSHTSRDKQGNITGYNGYSKQSKSKHSDADELPESDENYKAALKALTDFFNDACEDCDKEKNSKDYTGPNGPLRHGEKVTTGGDGGYGKTTWLDYLLFF